MPTTLPNWAPSATSQAMGICPVNQATSKQSGWGAGLGAGLGGCSGAGAGEGEGEGSGSDSTGDGCSWGCMRLGLGVWRVLRFEDLGTEGWTARRPVQGVCRRC